MKALLLAATAALTASPALAHVDAAAHGSLAAGLAHPMMGADHLLAMVAVGLLAAATGGRALLALPAAFVGSMALGYAATLAGLALPMVEPMIMASVLILGVLVALAAQLPLAPAAALIAVFGAAHGAAHGAELGQAGALTFGAGFLLATAALHAAGLGLGRLTARLLTGQRVLRALGAVVALAGGALSLA
ncbi:MAG: HupE/UreJ family protein [Rhodobacterales bacterium]|nr:HupE/UreJ family protein [Rhodobacterales bacterium]